MIRENKCQTALILENRKLSDDVYRLAMQVDMKAEPGQFVQVQIPGFYLRRPISVHDVTEDGLVLIYKTVGQGTERLANMKEGKRLNLFGPLGTGFPVEARDVVLIGGGVGVPPLYYTAKKYLENQNKVTVVLGFNTKNQIFLEEDFRKLGCETITATMDGSYGIKGTVIDALKVKNISTDFVLACGPKPMLKAVSETCRGYISLESRMACGIGACMGCVVKDRKGESRRVCKDGPVFAIGEVEL